MEKSRIMRLYIWPLVVFMILLAGCQKNMKITNWKPKILAPLINGTISVESLSDIRNKHFVQDVPSLDIGYVPGIAVTVPKLYIKHVGPFAYQLSQYFAFASVDSANLTLSFTNNFPITIGKGTRIVFRSSSDTNTNANIIYSHTVINDIPTNTVYNFNTILRNATVYNNLWLSIDSFLSPGGKVTFTNKPTVLDFKINVIKVNKVGLYTNRQYTYWDSTNLDLTGNSTTNNLNDSSASGILRTYITNRIPANVRTQMFFYDGNNKFVDSLYYGVILAPAATTDTINGIPTVTIEKKYDYPINAKRINNLRRTKYVKYKVTGDTYGLPGSVVVAGKETGANVLIISNLQIDLANLLNNNH